MAPTRLGELAGGSAQARELRAGRMQSVGDGGGRPRQQMLAEREQRSSAPRGKRLRPRRDRRVRGAERGAVGEMHRGPHEPPARAARDRLAKQLDVVEATAEGALVERLLRGPGRRSERSRARALELAASGFCYVLGPGRRVALLTR